ncbi:ABC transporter permease [Pseudochelatococcus lubricantis]|uniref:ABC transporter permease n=1 Tax=Pseudochelatococcus lubricantis TaxID=1538102 RepID=UPI0035EF9DF3
MADSNTPTAVPATAPVGARRGRPVARLAMFAHLVWRSLLVRSGRLEIALGAIVIGAAIVSALTSLYFDISIKMSQELRAFGPNLIVSPREVEADAPGRRGVDEAMLRAAVAAIPPEKLVGGSPYLYGLVRLDLGNAVLMGADLAALHAISPYWQVEGSWVSADFDDRNAMVGRRLAQSMELAPGSVVTIAGADGAQARVTVKGVMDTGENEDSQIVVNLGLAQRLLGMPGRADFAMVSVAAQGPEADAITAALTERFPELNARPIRKVSENDGQILKRIEGLMALVAAIILVITTLSVNATLTAMITERTPQIGLQKALGASNRDIVAQILAETAAICLAAVAIGLLLGFGLAQLLGQAVFGAWVTFRPVVVPLTLGVSLLAALLAAVLPVRGAVNVVPARVLRGE